MGTISLRRRVEATLGVDVFEVKLEEEFLMSSLFTVAEEELARLGLAEVEAEPIDVLVGGLGLGYTAGAVLEDPRVASLTVVEALAPVIDWHRRGLVPDADALAADPRVRLVQGDFFALAAGGAGWGEGTPPRYDAILLDIDHTPRHLLSRSHAPFYTREGLLRLRQYLKADAVFALWSDDPPDEEFLEVLSSVFSRGWAQVVTFPNALTGGESSNTVYLARS